MTIRYPAIKGETVTTETVEVQVTLKVKTRKTTNITFQGSHLDPPEGVEVTEAIQLEIDGLTLDLEEYLIPDRIKARFMNIIIDEVNEQVEGEDFI